ncbi:Aspartate carbamoyltransferase [Candidatus Bilamarchaeum dharawalense]|uniref:Aspartate carbamoyltransferase n=1 Tax=Candidatus Bilamarchaeum dharawalense TaxID=2885759 RepID=A0A5E4LP64_9ARCH|nr:Aspartate carbamoyltransferase [Candidatus Bilamarchaeum dharawalense]
MDLISIRDLSKKDIEGILDAAEEIQKGKRKPNLEGKILATLFFEASTRTKLSFQSAAMRNKMGYVDFLPETSSLKKGESYIDTIKTVAGYADVLAVRHPKEGSARFAADSIDKPVVNGGDGANQHPTQTLIDLFSIRKGKGRIGGLNVTLLGDLKYARTMRSLVYGLAMFGANVTLVSPPGLEMEQSYLDEIKKTFKFNVEFKNEPEYSQADVLYVCRIQQERFADPYEAKRVTEKFAIKKDDLKDAKEDLIILHPLPKINEIEATIDQMKQAKYFEQAHNGVPVRQAVLEYALSR